MKIVLEIYREQSYMSWLVNVSGTGIGILG